jgi:tetratricopeptide (TPR) repeat protein
VRYVLEGSVRKAANRVRITAQLIESQADSHLWADRIDGALEDIFDLQDEVTEKVIAALAPSVEHAEIERAQRKSTAHLGAYDCYLRALDYWRLPNRENTNEATRLLRKALELDPTHSSALGLLLAVSAHRRGLGMVTDAGNEKAEVERLVQRAVRIGGEDAVALAHTAWAIAYVLHDLRFALEQVQQALTLNPNLASAWAFSGWIHVWSGDPAEAVEHLSRSARLDPIGVTGPRLAGLAHAYFFLDRYEESLDVAESLVRRNPDAHPALRIAAASAAFAGRTKEANLFAARLRDLDPLFRLSGLEEYLGPYRPAAFREKYREGLRMAGLPE